MTNTVSNSLVPDIFQAVSSPVIYKKGEKIKEIMAEKKILGEGSSGKVYILKSNPSLVMKKILLPNYRPDTDILREFHLGLTLNHLYLVKYRFIYIKEYSDQKKYKLVMDKIEGHTLDKIESLDDTKIKKLLKQARDCVGYLLGQKVYWCDLNPGNIFITENNDLKLCDFGLWSFETDSIELTRSLLQGSMQLVKQLLLISSLRKKYDDKISSPYNCLPSKFIDDTGKNWTSEEKMEWFDGTLVDKLRSMSDLQKREYLEGYFDFIINQFESDTASTSTGFKFWDAYSFLSLKNWGFDKSTKKNDSKEES